MHSYTREREEKMYRISPEDDHYMEELLEAAKGFRSFGKAMEAFLVSQGYRGDLFSNDEKAAYIAEKFRQSGITVHRRNGGDEEKFFYSKRHNYSYFA